MRRKKNDSQDPDLTQMPELSEKVIDLSKL